MDGDREIRRALAAFVTFLAMLVLIVAVTLIATGCAQDGQRTYDLELEERQWKATKVYDATSGRSWWLLRRENSSNYLVLEGGDNVSVG